MRRVALTLAAALGALGAPERAAAQVSLELRGGASVGNYEAAAAGLETEPRPTLAVAVERPVARLLSVYGGYSRAAFGCVEGFCTGRRVSFTSSGVAAGVRFHPPRLPWVRAGALLHTLHTRAEGGPAPFRSTSGYSPGYELGGGVALPLTPRLHLLPSVGYRTHGVPADGATDRVSILSAEVGIRIRVP